MAISNLKPASGPKCIRKEKLRAKYIREKLVEVVKQ
jgi:hypothetical protein